MKQRNVNNLLLKGVFKEKSKVWGFQRVQLFATELQNASALQNDRYSPFYTPPPSPDKMRQKTYIMAE